MNSANEKKSVAAIEMRHVSVSRMKTSEALVVEDVNWTVNAGEFWVLAGLQGSGKTDFLMMTAGLMSPHAGEYRFFGERMPIFEEARLSERLRLGMVFDGGQLFNRMTIAENIALPLRYHRDMTREAAEARVQAMMELTELIPFAHSMPGNVARPWKKRAGLARALILEPDVLLVDNPLTGLDARHVQWWLKLLTRLARGETSAKLKPMTIIATADDLSRAADWRRCTDHVACLGNRKLKVFHSWQELEGSRDETVLDLLDAARPAAAIDQE